MTKTNPKTKRSQMNPENDELVNINYIESLAKIMSCHDLSQIKIQSDDFKLSLRRGNTISNLSEPIMQMQIPSQPPASSDDSKPAGILVQSPMVGNVYLSPQPGSPPFTDIGQKVKEGDTLMIIEAMKVMNPILSPCTGTVLTLHVENSQPVEFDEILISIDPA